MPRALLLFDPPAEFGEFLLALAESAVARQAADPEYRARLAERARARRAAGPLPFRLTIAGKPIIAIRRQEGAGCRAKSEKK
jgi:hypothetical protein